MNEIILFNKKKKKDLISNQANEQTIAELESDYKTLVFTKEDKLIQQESELNSQAEEILKVEAMIKELELKEKDVVKNTKKLDYELQRLGQTGHIVP